MSIIGSGILHQREDVCCHHVRGVAFVCVLIACVFWSFAAGVPRSIAAESVPLPPKKPQALQRPSSYPPIPAKKPIVVAKNNVAASAMVLSAQDITLYREIFALQEQGRMDEAGIKTAQLNDFVLYGYVQQQRYLHPHAYRSNFEELRHWLSAYADHPDAARIYSLAERKRPSGSQAHLKEPQNRIKIVRRYEPTMIAAKRYESNHERTGTQQRDILDLQKDIFRYISRGKAADAMRQLNDNKDAVALDEIEYDILRAKIASVYLYQGNMKQAFELAKQSAARSGIYVPLAHWVCGLIAWKSEDYTQAARYFETVGRSSYTSSWMRAAGAYWAARAHMRRGDVKSVSTWLRRASASPRTFYGLIATRSLGEDFDFNWSMPDFTAAHKALLLKNARARRAMALIDLGEISMAQAELLRVDVFQNSDLADALLALAHEKHLPALAMRLGANPLYEGHEVGHYQDAALYPEGPWQPLNGFSVQKALIYAIVRRESRFDPYAQSPSGATGLMQLMPATARSVSDYQTPHLDDAAVNLELGQRYIKKLLKSYYVQDDLVSLLVAYNAGPGNLGKWKKRWDDVEDPLLFIELMPSAQTRTYVEHVLANYWIYSLKEQQSTQTLDAIVAGLPVKYADRATARGGGTKTASAE